MRRRVLYVGTHVENCPLAILNQEPGPDVVPPSVGVDLLTAVFLASSSVIAGWFQGRFPVETVLVPTGPSASERCMYPLKSRTSKALCR